MFYKELENTNLLNKEELVKLDNYLAFTPQNSVITKTKLLKILTVTNNQLNNLFHFLEEKGIIKSSLTAFCSNCGTELFASSKKDLLEEVQRITNKGFCDRCNAPLKIDINNIYIGYNLIKGPTASENEIKELTSKLLKI